MVLPPVGAPQRKEAERQRQSDRETVCVDSVLPSFSPSFVCTGQVAGML